MTSPAPALLVLRDQINARWPSRSKAADGIMGDAAHQARKSDHNDGNALDVTLDAANGPNLDDLAEALLADARVTYVIWNARIQYRTIQPGVWREYSGTNPHKHHLHVSIREDAHDDTTEWNLDGGGGSSGQPATGNTVSTQDTDPPPMAAYAPSRPVKIAIVGSALAVFLAGYLALVKLEMRRRDRQTPDERLREIQDLAWHNAPTT